VSSTFARFIVRHRLPILAVWIVLAALALPRAMSVHEVLRVEGQTLSESESKTGRELIREAFPLPVTHFFVVTMRGPLPIDSLSYGALLDSLTRVAASEPYISQTASYLTTRDSMFISEDRLTTFFIAATRPDLDRSPTDFVPDFRDAIHSTVDRITWAASYEVHVTGGPALDYDVRTVSKEDTEIGERKSLPFSALVLILAFGALVAALVPLVIGVLAIMSALGLVHVAAGFYPMSVFVLTIVSMVGLGVGIDYSLLIVTRFREEMNRGRGPREAAMRTIDTAGRAVITSGLTVLLGFAALLITPTSETRSVGIGGVLVVTAAVLLAVTLLPGVLSLIGRTIDRPRWLAKWLAWYHAPTGWEPAMRWLHSTPSARAVRSSLSASWCRRRRPSASSDRSTSGASSVFRTRSRPRCTSPPSAASSIWSPEHRSCGTRCCTPIPSGRARARRSSTPPTCPPTAAPRSSTSCSRTRRPLRAPWTSYAAFAA
jgi:RND superfamily putative drug exporter